MSSLKFSAQEARDIIYEDDDRFEVIETTNKGKTRWSVLKRTIVKETLTGKLYEFNYSEGATEQQDERAFEYDNEVEAHRVFAVLVTTKVYKRFETSAKSVAKQKALLPSDSPAK